MERVSETYIFPGSIPGIIYCKKDKSYPGKGDSKRTAVEINTGGCKIIVIMVKSTKAPESQDQSLIET